MKMKLIAVYLAQGTSHIFLLSKARVLINQTITSSIAKSRANIFLECNIAS